MIRFTKYLSFGMLSLLLLACSQKVVEAPVESERLPREKKHELISALDSLILRKPSFFYTKISTSYTDTTTSISFKTSVRMVKDSATNILITYAKIPIVNSMFSQDTVKIVNKKDKCYIQQSLDFFRQNFGVDVSYANLEEILLGMPLDYDTTIRYFKIHDPANYVISSHKKRTVKRVERIEDRVDDFRTEKEKERDRQREQELERIRKIQDEIIIKYYLSADKRELKAMKVESVADSTFIDINYVTREWINGISIPKEVNLLIRTPRNSIRLELVYEKVELDMPQQLYFVIPEDYEVCN